MEDKLGEAVLVLSAKTKELLDGINQGKKAASSLQSHFGSVASSIRGLLGLAGVGFAFRTILNETIAAENSFRRLEAAVRSSGGAAGFSASQLKLQSEALQRATIFSDESIQSVQAALLRFRNIQGEVFVQATKSILDFAGSEAEAATAARTLGLAINNPIEGMTLLRRSGVSLNVELREQIRRLQESGNLQAAQKLLLGELAKSYGGTATAARDTLGGALKALKNRFSDIFLEIQGPGLTASKQLVETFIGFLPSIAASLSGAFAAVKAFVEGMVERIFFLGQAINRLAHLDIAGMKESLAQVPTAFDLVGNSVRAAQLAFEQTSNAIKATDSAASSAAATIPGKMAPIKGATLDVANAMKSLRESGATSLGGLTSQLVQSQLGFNQWAEAVVKQILIVVAQMAVLSAFGPGLGTAFAGGFFGGFRAHGGEVSGGRGYVVGEEGPELFVPKQSGTVVPNGGGGATVNMSLNVSGMDFSDDQTIKRVANSLTDAVRRGVAEAVAMTSVVVEQGDLNSGRAY